MMLNFFYLLSCVFIAWLIFGNRLSRNRYGAFLSVRKITGNDDSKYLLRHYLLPRNKILNVYLHRFYGSDDARALHDHPWYSASIVLKGNLIEHLPDNHSRVISPGKLTVRGPKFQHRIELPAGTTATTLFCTGPVLRTWGFICADGWVPWRQYDKQGGCK